MTQHTPGPWDATALPSRFDVRDAGNVLVCSMSWHASYREHYTLKEESRANARLIAAAPDLLQALQAIVALDDGDKPDLWHFEDEFNAARDAIAEATGSP